MLMKTWNPVVDPEVVYTMGGMKRPSRESIGMLGD